MEATRSRLKSNNACACWHLKDERLQYWLPWCVRFLESSSSKRAVSFWTRNSVVKDTKGLGFRNAWSMLLLLTRSLWASNVWFRCFFQASLPVYFLAICGLRSELRDTGMWSDFWSNKEFQNEFPFSVLCAEDFLVLCTSVKEHFRCCCSVSRGFRTTSTPWSSSTTRHSSTTARATTPTSSRWSPTCELRFHTKPIRVAPRDRPSFRHPF